MNDGSIACVSSDAVDFSPIKMTSQPKSDLVDAPPNKDVCVTTDYPSSSSGLAPTTVPKIVDAPLSDKTDAILSPQEPLERPFSSRLGQCQRCLSQAAKYTCPGCGEHTCSLSCSVAHKAATGCLGRRDPTKFLSLGQFTDADMMSDYRFLESVDHSLDRVVRLRQSLGAPGCALSRQQRELQAFCKSQRGLRLVYMPQGMVRRRHNRSHLRRQQRQGAAVTLLHWTVEVRFPTATKFASACDEARLRDVLQRWRHLWPLDSPECFLCRLDEGDRLCQVDWELSLAQLLQDTVIVEFPVFAIRATK